MPKEFGESAQFWLGRWKDSCVRLTSSSSPKHWICHFKFWNQGNATCQSVPSPHSSSVSPCRKTFLITRVHPSVSSNPIMWCTGHLPLRQCLLRGFGSFQLLRSDTYFFNKDEKEKNDCRSTFLDLLNLYLTWQSGHIYGHVIFNFMYSAFNRTAKFLEIFH